MAAWVTPFFLSPSVYNLLDIHNWPKFPLHSTAGHPQDPSVCILNVGILYLCGDYGAKGVVAASDGGTNLSSKEGGRWKVVREGLPDHGTAAGESPCSSAIPDFWGETSETRES